MVDLSGFNADKVAPNAPREVIPAGEYVAIIKDSEKKETKAQDGHFIKLTLQVIDGPYKNRSVFDNLNLWNKSDQAVQIAQSTLSAICHAVGVKQPKDSSQLHNKPLCVSVKTRMYNGEPQNEVVGYKSIAEKGKKPDPPAVAVSTDPMQEAKDKAPWD